MKIPALLTFCVLLFTACQPTSGPTADEAATDVVSTDSPYPAALQEVFTAHGGLEQWRAYGTMRYEIVKEAGNELQIIDLKDRRERIEAPDFTMGYDGENYWLAADTSEYKGNPIFYKNLMFYFYAMPFVLADDGIQYSEAEPLIFDDKPYPGFRISYESGVGESPEDEYFIHYDSETKQMTWLGYTVTYYSQEKSVTVKWIRYDDWVEVEGLLLPKSLAWYELQNNLPTTERNRRVFTGISLRENQPADSTFAMTADAFVVK